MSKPDKNPGRNRPTEESRFTYNVSSVIRETKFLAEAVGDEFENKTPRGASFDRLVDLVWERLPGNLNPQKIEDSLRDLAGTFLTKELIYKTCWRMVGNVQRLRRNFSVPSWNGQKIVEWVPLQVVSTCYMKQGYRPGVLLGCQVMAGTPCSLMLFRWWSVTQCAFFAKDFGFSAPWGRYPFAVPEQLVSLRFYGRIVPRLCTPDPQFDKPGFPASLFKHNRKVIKRRFRVDPGYKCPIGLPSDFPCHHCPKGYKSCPAAVHREDWVKKACPGCNREDAPFDPGFPSNLCVDCQRKAAFRGS
jgi:hypothetical protein